MKKQIGLNVFLIHKNNHDNIKITFIKQPNVLIKSLKLVISKRKKKNETRERERERFLIILFQT
jgi:hypothetical protein